MDNLKNSELLELKTKLIKDIRNWKPSGCDSPDCFTILHDYNVAFEKLNCDKNSQEASSSNKHYFKKNIDNTSSNYCLICDNHYNNKKHIRYEDGTIK